MTEMQDLEPATRLRGSNAGRRDLVFVVLGVVGAYLLAGAFDLSEKWFHWIEAHEGLELDEVPIGLSLASLGLAYYAFRRWRESNAMARLLNQSNEFLEERVLERTAMMKAQASDLEHALKMQIEYNSLQREFISMASHEFRTPLSIIDGTAQRILRKIDQITTEEMIKRIGKIRSASARMIGLIESTLSAEQLEAGKIKIVPQPTDLTKLLKVVQRRQEDATPSHQIKLDIQNFPDEIHGDPKLLEQVFSNLLSNAVKYSPESPRIEVTGRREGNNVHVTVRDVGIGVPVDEMPRLFQRYFRSRTTIGIAGTGIGLHVVKQFVELHGGAVQVESVEGEGSTFTVQLPITCGQGQGSDSNDGHDPLTRPAVTAAA